MAYCFNEFEGCSQILTNCKGTQNPVPFIYAFNLNIVVGSLQQKIIGMIYSGRAVIKKIFNKNYELIWAVKHETLPAFA